MSLSNAGRNPAAAQSNQDEHAAEDGQQDDADQHFEGILTKKASKPIQQLEEALVKPHVCQSNHTTSFRVTRTAVRRLSRARRTTTTNTPPRLGSRWRFRQVGQCAVCENYLDTP
jgi:hypothetical protein